MLMSMRLILNVVETMEVLQIHVLEALCRNWKIISTWLPLLHSKYEARFCLGRQFKSIKWCVDLK